MIIEYELDVDTLLGAVEEHGLGTFQHEKSITMIWSSLFNSILILNVISPKSKIFDDFGLYPKQLKELATKNRLMIENTDILEHIRGKLSSLSIPKQSKSAYLLLGRVTQSVGEEFMPNWENYTECQTQYGSVISMLLTHQEKSKIKKYFDYQASFNPNHLVCSPESQNFPCLSRPIHLMDELETHKILNELVNIDKITFNGVELKKINLFIPAESYSQQQEAIILARANILANSGNSLRIAEVLDLLSNLELGICSEVHIEVISILTERLAGNPLPLLKIQSHAFK